jgi:neutral ceramidase
MQRREFLASSVLAAAQASAAQLPPASLTKPARGKIRAGAAAANINAHIGGSLAGNFTEARSRNIHDDLSAKSLVLDNGSTRLAIVLVDLCVLPASVNIVAKQMIEAEAGVPQGNALFCCTHTHSAPTTMHLFQAQPDPGYLDFLTRRIVDSVKMAVARLQPAQIGFGFGREERIAFNRRYELKPGTVSPNPFGAIDRVKTNPGVANPSVIRPVGPIDPTVGILSVRRGDSKPLALVGNYSLHYVGGVNGGDVSADYFAWWAAEMGRRMGVGTGPGDPPFVAMLTNGAQGDINNIDVMNGRREREAPYTHIREVANILADESARVLDSVRYSDEAELAAGQEWLELAVRMPTADEVGAARKLLGNAPKQGQLTDLPLVYARETVIMSETFPRLERVPVQALRIGDTGFVGFAGEPFVELGLEVRKKSPFRQQFLIGLSNHHVGYLPTIEAHEQGGYETWRAKTSYLEKEAAPKVVAAALRRLASIGS